MKVKLSPKIKKAEFLLKVKKIRRKMKEKGLKEEEILKDFEKFSLK